MHLVLKKNYIILIIYLKNKKVIVLIIYLTNKKLKVIHFVIIIQTISSIELS